MLLGIDRRDPSPSWASTTTHVVVVLTVGVAVCSTTGLGIGQSWTDEQRIVLSALLALSGAWVALRHGTDSIDPRASVACLGVVAIGAVSAALAARPSASWAEWAVLALILWLILSGHLPDRLSLQRSAGFFAAAVAICYVTGVVANIVAAWVVDMPIGRDSFLVGFSNPRFPAHLQALTLPLMPLALAAVRRPLARAFVGLAFALWWMCWFGSGSRTAWLAMLGAAVVALLLGQQGRQWLRIQTAFAVAGGVLYILIFFVLAPMQGAVVEVEVGRIRELASIEARVGLARIAASLVAASPLLGVGPMHFSYVDNGLGAHPHNFWLQLVAEWGAPAGLLSLALFVTLFRRHLQATRKSLSRSEDIGGSTCLLAATAAWFVGTQFDGYMVVPTSQAASAVLLMLLVADWRLASNSLNTTRHDSGSTFLPIAWAATVVAAIAALASLPLTSFGQPTYREAAWRTENPTSMFWPRFWQQGWIGPDADPTAR